ncbi:hypothetical protein [Allorhodopirellula heiligendammensis]|uniref:Uncharacterized protein n=1 Tax=Allorhodopirellula heiligendammensis TaxID=2714739 RepID=A0A5C6BXB8_9BACT|nr:hypothetical protein [Allorhodopirellula heiligendammensis]TWU16518.1 hypothetical protein Poly21_37230 [Allorhodopirellula heiligendammensis]
MRRKKNPRAKTKSNSIGLFQVLLFTTFFYVVNGVTSSPLESQSVLAQTTGLPFQEIGSPSAVDRYSERGRYTATGYRAGADDVDFQRRPATPAPVRQVSMQSGGFSAPPQGAAASPQLNQVPTQFAPPPLDTPPQLSSQGIALPPGTVPASPQTLSPPPSDSSPLSPPSLSFSESTPPPASSLPPRSLPNPTRDFTSGEPSYAAPPIADYAPVPPPQLSNGGYATMADCRLITPPSSYTAMSPYGGTCGSVAPTNYASPYTPPPAQIAAPAAMPPMTVSPPVTVSPPSTVSSTVTIPPPMTVPPSATVVSPPAAAPVGSLVTFGQETLPVQVGQGLWGQPVAYVPGQRCRNWLRYLSF